MTIRITYVDAIALTTCTKQRCRTHLDDVDMGGHEGIKAQSISHERDVVDVASRRYVSEEINQRRSIDSERNKWRIASTPLVQSFGYEAKVVAVPRHRTFDVTDAQHDVVDTRDH